MSAIEFTAWFGYSAKMAKLLQMLNDKEVRKKVNEIIGKAINNYVPRKSGALQESMKVTEDAISWGEGLEYAHYQYMGEVYGPNRPIMLKGMPGTIVGWYSPATGSGSKYPTGKELGVPGEWMGWRFGYSEPNTKHHWISFYQYKLKAETNREITRYLKQECKARGLKT